MSKYKPISQREARALQKRVIQLECDENNRRNVWHRDYPGGTNIYQLQVSDTCATAVRTARRLGHAVVCIDEPNDVIRFLALPLGDKT